MRQRLGNYRESRVDLDQVRLSIRFERSKLRGKFEGETNLDQGFESK